MSNNTSSGGIGFLGLLTIVFIVLKLTHYIDWSWLWVLCPLWAPLAIWLMVGFVSLLLVLWAKLFSTSLQKEQMKRIQEDMRQSAGKSKWDIRREQILEAQKRMSGSRDSER